MNQLSSEKLDLTERCEDERCLSWCAFLFLQVHILQDPTKEELGRKLEKLHPDFLLLHGESSPVKDEIGSLVIRDGKPLSADTLASLYGAKVPNLVLQQRPMFRQFYVSWCQSSGCPIIDMIAPYRSYNTNCFCTCRYIWRLQGLSLVKLSVLRYNLLLSDSFLTS